MSQSQRNLVGLSKLPSDERIRALERIIPLASVQEVVTVHGRRVSARVQARVLALAMRVVLWVIRAAIGAESPGGCFDLAAYLLSGLPGRVRPYA